MQVTAAAMVAINRVLTTPNIILQQWRRLQHVSYLQHMAFSVGVFCVSMQLGCSHPPHFFKNGCIFTDKM